MRRRAAGTGRAPANWWVKFYGGWQNSFMRSGIFVGKLLLLFCGVAAVPLLSAAPSPRREPPPVIDPSAPDPDYVAGLEAFTRGDAAPADAALARFLARGNGTSVQRARAAYTRGRIARAAGRPAAAGDFFMQARRFDPPFAAMRKSDAQWTALAAGAVPGRPPRLNAAQVFVLPGDRPLAATLDALQSAGFDTLILRAFQLPGDRYHAGLGGPRAPVQGVYFKTDEAPVVAPLLETVAAAAHARGMRVIAWLTSRGSDFLAGAARDKFLDPATGALRDSDRLDLFDPLVRDRLQRLYLDALNAGADGLLFQDDLVYKSFEGFSQRGQAALAVLPGAPSPRSLFTTLNPVAYAPPYGAFAAVKAGLISRFAGETARLLHSAHPGALLLVNVYYDTVLDAGHGRDWLAQDLAGDLAAGADYLAIMAYARQIQQERQLSPAAAAKAVSDMPAELRRQLGDIAPARLLFKLQTTDWKDGRPLPTEEILPLYHDLESGGHSLGLAPAPEGALLEKLREGTKSDPDSED